MLLLCRKIYSDAGAEGPTWIGGTSTGEEQGAAIALMPRLRPRAAAFGVAGAAVAAKALAGSAWATAAGTRMLQMSPASLFSSSLQQTSISDSLVQAFWDRHHQAVDVQRCHIPRAGAHGCLWP